MTRSSGGNDPPPLRYGAASSRRVDGRRLRFVGDQLAQERNQYDERNTDRDDGSVGNLWVTILPSTRIKNDVDLLRLTFLDRFEAGIPVIAELQGFCTLIQGSHLFIPLGEAALPDHLARIFSRDSAIGVPNLDAHAHDADVTTAEGEDVALDRKKGPIIRGAIAGDNSQGTH